MQYPSIYSQIKAQAQPPPPAQPQFPEHEQLKCPRCESANTKFCYYNNYNLSQPRYFCKNCRRYWTKGGALRNIPVGGGSRKNSKRSSSASSSPPPSSNNPKRPAHATTARLSLSSSSTPLAPAPTSQPSSSAAITESLPPPKAQNYGTQFENLMDVNGSFSSLLGSTAGQFTDLLNGLSPNCSNLQSRDMVSDQVPGSGGHSMDLQLVLEGGGDSNAGFLNIPTGGGGTGGDSGCWNVGDGSWPDLAIYTPGSTFQL